MYRILYIQSNEYVHMYRILYIQSNEYVHIYRILYLMNSVSVAVSEAPPEKVKLLQCLKLLLKRSRRESMRSLTLPLIKLLLKREMSW